MQPIRESHGPAPRDDTTPSAPRDPEVPHPNAEALARFGRLASVGHSVEAVISDAAELLSAIQGRCDLALRQPGAAASAEVRDAQVLAARCATMLQRITTYTRGDAARWSCSLLDVTGLVQSHVSLCCAAGMPLRFYVAEDVRLACSPTQLQQVLQNLILYLYDTVGRGEGRIVVRAHRHARYATIEVAHDGPGIADDVRTRLFEPFATPHGTGAGLTLFIARTIVEAHRGYLGFFSSPERGTTFHIVLPRARIRAP